MIWKLLKRIYRIIKNVVLDYRSKKYLIYNKRKKHSKEKKMKVGFIVFEPETWDKIEPVYMEMKTRVDIDCNIIIVPSFDQKLELTTDYGKELDFFKKIDSNSILAYDNGGWINIENDGYDYVFYQDPYNQHMPFSLKSSNVVKFTKICYIPYGMSGSNNFIENNTNKDFFRNVYCEFVDTPEVQKVLEKRYRKNVRLGYQNFILLGYPALMRYSDYYYNKIKKKVLWTPRWSYDQRVGGSNFMEYKDDFLRLVKNNPDMKFEIRPHPMMFTNFIKEGIITEDEIKRFEELSKKYGLIKSAGNALDEDFFDTDILITDFSSIISQFFMTARPIIYCSSHIKFNGFYELLSNGMYIANNWDDVLKYYTMLKDGNDYLYSTRVEIIKKVANEHNGAELRIVDYILNDYNESNII